MLSDEKKQPAPAADVYAEAQRCWEALSRREESAITMRSIFVTVRLSLQSPHFEEGLSDLIWLLQIGQYLADIETYRPVDA